MKPCETITNEILLGKISEKTEKHLQECRDCRAFLKTLEKIGKLTPSIAQIPARLTWEALHAPKKTPPVILWPHWAAAAVLLIAVSLLFYPSPPSSSTDWQAVSWNEKAEQLNSDIWEMEKDLAYDMTNAWEVESENTENEIEELVTNQEV